MNKLQVISPQQIEMDTNIISDIKVAFLLNKPQKLIYIGSCFKQLDKRWTWASLQKNCQTDNGFSNHPYFQQPSQKLLQELTQSDIQKLKELNTTLFRSNDQDSLNLKQNRKNKVNKLKQKLQKISRGGYDSKRYFIIQSSRLSQNTKSTWILTEFEIFEEHQSQ